MKAKSKQAKRITKLREQAKRAEAAHKASEKALDAVEAEFVAATNALRAAMKLQKRLDNKAQKLWENHQKLEWAKFEAQFKLRDEGA